VSCSERAARVLGPAYHRTDQNRVLCADVCSSLRVLFDTSLGSGLHPLEQQKSDRLRTEFYNNGRALSPTAHSPPTVQSVYRYTSPRYELLPDLEAEKTPNLPCLNCPAHDILRLFVNLPRILESLSMTLCRRAIVSRHLAMFLDYLERTSTYWFTEVCPVEFETKLSVRNAIPTASTDHIKSKLTTAQSTSETSSSTEPLVQISESTHRTSRTNRRGVPTSLGVPSLRGANPNTSVSNGNLVKTEGDPVPPTSSQSSDPHISISTPTRSTGSPPAPNISKHLQPFGPHQCLPRQKLRSLQIVSSSEHQIQSGVSSVQTNKSVRSPTLSKTHTQPLRCSTRLTERPITTEGRILRPRCVNRVYLQCVHLSDDRACFGGFLIRPIRSCGPPCVYSAAGLRSCSSVTSQPASSQSNIHPPLKKYRDHTSVLRSLAACVQPCPDAPDFRLGGDPWLGSTFQSRTFLLARAKGRLAARLAARDYFPNDVVAIAKEVG
ncbi:hypothetical protein PHET_10491, partial [Paragonimus heterotremus]